MTRTRKETLNWAGEGGHSEFRILHHKDVTGKEIERALLETVGNQKNIEIHKHWFVLDLITQHHLGYLVTKSTPDIECYGVYALDQHTHKIVKILSKITLLATGGNGQAYRTTTNPRIATGDGVAMVYRAKGRIENMEFIQFHPTALFEAGVSPPSSSPRPFAATAASCVTQRVKPLWTDTITGKTSLPGISSHGPSIAR